MAIIAISHWRGNTPRVGDKQSWIQELERQLPFFVHFIRFDRSVRRSEFRVGIREATFPKAKANATTRFTA
jgi:hypothetical protein